MLVCTALLNILQPVQVAADTKAPKPLELPVPIEHRQARHFNSQALVGIVEGPKQDDSAEGFPRRDHVCDLGLRIEFESPGNLRPTAVKYGRGLRPEQIGKFLTCKVEVIVSISAPDETEWKTVWLCRCNRKQVCRRSYSRLLVAVIE